METDLGLGLRCLQGALIFGALLLPIYLAMRGLTKLVRIRYGFAEEPVDDGPPLRVCDRCANTVLEPDFAHCPYCGEVLPVPKTKAIAAVDDTVEA